MGFSLGIEKLLVPGASSGPKNIEVDEFGRVFSLAELSISREMGDSKDRKNLSGLVMPGLCNLHSHAFQILLSGKTQERAQTSQESQDSFWTWRKRMYSLADTLGPGELEKAASWLYAILLAHGFTHVAEFHYLHKGNAEMGRALLRAAERVGMGMTLLPVLYLHGGPGKALSPDQVSFGIPGGVEGYFRVFEALESEVRGKYGLSIGFAPHSLRAVAPEELSTALKVMTQKKVPIHIHIAEQRREVREIEAAYGARPVRWLLENAPVDSTWCLVHATHMDPLERKSLAQSGATLGLCPSTEADLGDGVFPLREFLDEGGCFGIGTDGQVGLCPAQELRLLEFEQRLQKEARNVLAGDDSPWTHVGRFLFDQALAGGRRAVGLPENPFEVGAPCDLVVLDERHPLVTGLDAEQILDAWVFHFGKDLVREVWKAGKRLVVDGRHVLQEELDQELREVMNP
jgi:formimidoylglutamate deiminase